MAVPSLKHDRNGIIHHSPRNIQPKFGVVKIRFACQPKSASRFLVERKALRGRFADGQWVRLFAVNS